MDDEYRAIGVTERGRFQRLQALEDAIAYRRARVTTRALTARSPRPAGSATTMPATWN